MLLLHQRGFRYTHRRCWGLFEFPRQKHIRPWSNLLPVLLSCPILPANFTGDGDRVVGIGLWCNGRYGRLYRQVIGAFPALERGWKKNLKKVSNFFKKGVDKRGRVWYYIRAPYETAQTKGTRREAINPDGKPVRGLWRTLKIKQRYEMKDP